MSSHNYSIIIPAWNEAQHLPATLMALKQAMAQVPESGEIIVVDNNSTDSTARIAHNFGARVVFEAQNNIGRARNAGAQEALTPILIFIDADTLIGAELLHETVNRMQSGRYYAGGAELSFNAPVPWPARLVTWIWNRTAQRRQAAAGSYLFVLKSEFMAIGGFNSEHFAAEEVYLCRALAKRNRRTTLSFNHIKEYPIQTSARKMIDRNPYSVFAQMILLGLCPFLLRSKRACALWYKR